METWPFISTRIYKCSKFWCRDHNTSNQVHTCMCVCCIYTHDLYCLRCHPRMRYCFDDIQFFSYSYNEIECDCFIMLLHYNSSKEPASETSW